MDKAQELYQAIGTRLSNSAEIELGQMFGKPVIKTKGKAFASFFQNAMVFKLGEEEIHLLKDKYKGSINWDPSGKNRPMKDWIQVPKIYHENWQDLALKARNFVEEGF